MTQIQTEQLTGTGLYLNIHIPPMGLSAKEIIFSNSTSSDWNHNLGHTYNIIKSSS